MAGELNFIALVYLVSVVGCFMTTDPSISLNASDIDPNNLRAQATNQSALNVGKFKCPTNIKVAKFPHQTDCRQFYICLMGNSILKQCYPNRLFDFNLRRCVDASYGRCFRLGHDVLGIEDAEVHKGNQQFDCATWIGKYRAPMCEQYWLCKYGNAYLKSCPGNKMFSENYRKCVPRSWSECKPQVAGNPAPTVPDDNKLSESEQTLSEKYDTTDQTMVKPKCPDCGMSSDCGMSPECRIESLNSQSIQLTKEPNSQNLTSEDTEDFFEPQQMQ